VKKIFVIVAVLCFLYACKKSVDAADSIDCSGAPKSFAADVAPIIQASCGTDSDCHGSGSTSGPGELLNYSQIFNARSAIRSAVLSRVMPKGGMLTASEKKQLYAG
jgi:hypothetical protein